ncbi:ferric reductase-like transmembrane domain-containing protein [Tepidamorphus sp. 3E244]|uniref:ferric reductase-like transmembrane domain-containing protein n=1 Tax=Tepidamorphus sp. 3E244 TaxID=3385498 RepID=UPI0038FCA047
MEISSGSRWRGLLIWAALALVIGVPFVIAAASPLMAWRQPVYIAASLAGVVAISLVLVQPLLAGGYLPGLPLLKGRRVHRFVGAGLVTAVFVHVAGLWITSPPDVIDALTFTSPTPFSAWGVIAMWAVFAAAALAALRQRLRIRPGIWRLAHTAFAIIIAVGSVIHAWLIQGTMGTISKAVICAAVIAAMARAVLDLRRWAVPTRRRQPARR